MKDIKLVNPFKYIPGPFATLMLDTDNILYLIDETGENRINLGKLRGNEDDLKRLQLELSRCILPCIEL